MGELTEELDELLSVSRPVPVLVRYLEPVHGRKCRRPKQNGEPCTRNLNPFAFGCHFHSSEEEKAWALPWETVWKMARDQGYHVKNPTTSDDELKDMAEISELVAEILPEKDERDVWVFEIEWLNKLVNFRVPKLRRVR